MPANQKHIRSALVCMSQTVVVTCDYVTCDYVTGGYVTCEQKMLGQFCTRVADKSAYDNM